MSVEMDSGLGLDETSAALAVLSTRFPSPAECETALRQALSNISTPPKSPSPRPPTFDATYNQSGARVLFGCGCSTCAAEHHRRDVMGGGSDPDARPCQRERETAELGPEQLAAVARWVAQGRVFAALWCAAVTTRSTSRPRARWLDLIAPGDFDLPF